MFCHEITTIRFIFQSAKPRIFRIPKYQSIPNTPSRCLEFSFSVEGLSNLNCLQREARKKLVSRSIVDETVGETIVRSRIIR